MSEAQDRVAMVSDLRALEERSASKDDLNALERRLEERFASKADLTALEERVKRHFDVVAERIESHVKIIAEANTHHMRILNDHESASRRSKSAPEQGALISTTGRQSQRPDRE